MGGETLIRARASGECSPKISALGGERPGGLLNAGKARVAIGMLGTVIHEPFARTDTTDATAGDTLVIRGALSAIVQYRVHG